VLALIVRWSSGVDTTSMRMTRLVAWPVAVVSIGLVGSSLVLAEIAAHAGSPAAGSWWLVPFIFAAVSSPALVGAMLLSREGRNPIAWILLLGGFSVAVTLTAGPYAEVALLAHPGSLPGGAWAGLVSDSFWPLFFAWPLAVTFAFPDGRLESRRWRPFAAMAALSIPLLVLLVAVMEQELESPLDGIASPLPATLPGPDWIRSPVWLALLASLIAGPASLVVRYRRSAGVQRLQIRWLLWAALLVPVGFASCLVWGAIAGESGELVLAVLLVAEAAAAVAVGVAVSRHGLYEIDRLINRTLVYGTLTAVLGLCFGGVTIAVGVVAGRGSSWATAAATLVVALLFRPLRAAVQRLVDRRFDRARHEGLALVRSFEAAVRDGHAPAEDVGRTLAKALGDPSAEFLFWLPETQTYVDAFGSSAETVQEWRARTEAMRDGSRLGLLLHDRRLSDHRDLLETVLGAAGLTIEIARLRVEVKMQLAQVEASRERIVEAGYAERRRLERDLHDGAQQRLVSLGLHLRRLQRSLPGQAQIVGPALGQAVDEIGHAISDLRQLAAGVRPARLDEGLAAALEDLARGVPLAVDVEAEPDRLPPSIEAAAYFVACEALTNAVKHASASRVAITARREDDRLVISVRDDGIGGAKQRRGTGLAGLHDRVEAHGGRMRIESSRTAGTLVEAVLPCAS
jgi:signal transduction histidine kinase